MKILSTFAILLTTILSIGCSKAPVSDAMALLRDQVKYYNSQQAHLLKECYSGNRKACKEVEEG